MTEKNEINNISRMLKITLTMLIVIIISSCDLARIQDDIRRGPLPYKRQMNAENGEVRVMAREYLRGNNTELPFYRYYAYLVFTEKSESTYQLREAAAKAFMCQFQDASEARKIGISEKDMAVFYAPVKSDVDMYVLKEYESSDALLDHYNYAFSQALISKLKQKVPIKNFKVGVVAYPMPLGITGHDFSSDGLEIINLSNTPPAQVANIIRKLRMAVTSPYNIRAVNVIMQDQNTGEAVERTIQVPIVEPISQEDWATKIRKVFASLGKMIMPLMPSAEAVPFNCK